MGKCEQVQREQLAQTKETIPAKSSHEPRNVRGALKSVGDSAAVLLKVSVQLADSFTRLRKFFVDINSQLTLTNRIFL